MKKILLLFVVVYSLALNASQINPGAFMCSTYSDMQAVAKHVNSNNLSAAVNLFDSFVAQGKCAEVIVRMNPDNLGRKDFGNGVTSIDAGMRTIYVLTEEIH